MPGTPSMREAVFKTIEEIAKADRVGAIAFPPAGTSLRERLRED